MPELEVIKTNNVLNVWKRERYFCSRSLLSIYTTKKTFSDDKYNGVFSNNPRIRNINIQDNLKEHQDEAHKNWLAH